MKTIKTWQERWNAGDHGDGVRSRDIAMQAEIDELRAQLEAQGETVAEFHGLPFAEAKKRILELNEVDAKGMAISLLIQNGILKKQATHPAPAAPVVGSQWFAELLRRAMPYVKEASVRYYDGTDGHSYRQSASGLLKKMEAALHPAQPKGEKA